MDTDTEVLSQYFCRRQIFSNSKSSSSLFPQAQPEIISTYFKSSKQGKKVLIRVESQNFVKDPVL